MILEHRFAAFEVREVEGRAIVEGRAMVYGSEADIGGMFREQVEAGAFELRDVILNFQHDRKQPLARQDGGGLELTDTRTELRVRAELPEARADIADLVKRRILRGFSVEMEVKSEEWPAPDRRVIKRAVLHGLALVDKAAYSDTTLELAQRMQVASTEQWPPLVL